VSDRTKWVAFLINAFPKVEKFTLVIDQLVQDGYESEYGPMKLIDPIHVDHTMASYNQFDPSIALSLDLPEPEEIEIDEVEVDPEEVMEELAYTFWELDEEDLPTTPQFEYKVAISENYAYDLNASREACQARIDEYCSHEVEMYEEY
jgi:hypothetical protein